MRHSILCRSVQFGHRLSGEGSGEGGSTSPLQSDRAMAEGGCGRVVTRHPSFSPTHPGALRV
jgi:hypothetical protein